MGHSSPVITEDGRQLFGAFRCEGKTVTLYFEGAYDFTVAEAAMSTTLHFRPSGAENDVAGTPADLGLAVRPRLGGANTAYHIPEGMMLAYGAGVLPDPSRKEVDLLDVAPSLLANVLGVEPAPSMGSSQPVRVICAAGEDPVVTCPGGVKPPRPPAFRC